MPTERLEARICELAGHLTAAISGGFAFYMADGTLIPASPPLPGGSADGLTACHQAVITPATIIPPHSGERLDLHLAIWACFAKPRTRPPAANANKPRRTSEPDRLTAEHIESAARAARELSRQRRRLIDTLLAEGFSQADLAREPGVTRQAIQKMVTAGQDGPRQ
jgi:hypothetical protein